MLDIKKKALAMQDRLIAWRRDFHRYPEPSYQERRTADIIEAELRRLGIDTVRVGDTGVLGTLQGARHGERAVALRADIDALPIQETAQHDYVSTVDGVMHACGHDCHTACLLGAAHLLAARRNDFGGQVRFIFQPAEELGGGANDMIAAGALDGVGRVFGLHTAPDLPAGSVGLKPGLNNASVDQFIITVAGRSTHVSTPHLGVDALYIASQIVVALQALVTRMSSPVEPLLIGVGKLTAGTTYNALAKQAVLEGTTRAVTVETRAWVRQKVEQTAKSIAALYGGTAEITWKDFASPLINDPQATAEAAKLMDDMFGPGHVVADRPLFLSGDNFAEYLLQVPGAYAYLGTGNPAKPGTQDNIHSSGFDIDEEVLPIGAALDAAYALFWLTGE